MEKINERENTEHLNAMIKALRSTKVFKIDRNHTQNTVIVTHPKAGEVFRAMKTNTDCWLITRAANLFN